MENDKSKYVTYRIRIDSDENNEDGETTEWSSWIFEDGGHAEDYMNWRIHFEELTEAKQLNYSDKKYAVLQTLLRGEAQVHFNSGWYSMVIPAVTNNAKKQGLEEKRSLLKGINALTKQTFAHVKSTWCLQRSYLWYHVDFGNMMLSESKWCFVGWDEFLQYFPLLTETKSRVH